MRLKIINPNTSVIMSHSIEESAKACCNPNTEITVSTSKMGPINIECKFDEALAVPGVLQEIILSEKTDPFDGYIIACFDDPGLLAAREITTKPVIGIAESALAMVSFLAPSFSIISVLDRSIYMNRELIRRLGAEHMCCSIRSSGMSIKEFEEDHERGLRALENQCRLAIVNDRAEALILGCAGFTKYAKKLQEIFSLPVVEGIQPAVKFMESIIQLSFTTSKINSFCQPSSKKYVGYQKFL